MGESGIKEGWREGNEGWENREVTVIVYSLTK